MNAVEPAAMRQIANGHTNSVRRGECPWCGASGHAAIRFARSWPMPGEAVYACLRCGAHGPPARDEAMEKSTATIRRFARQGWHSRPALRGSTVPGAAARPCPFCAATPTTGGRFATVCDTSTQFACRECGALGPIHYGRAREYLECDPPGGWCTRHRAAIRLWNDGLPAAPSANDAALYVANGRLCWR